MPIGYTNLKSVQQDRDAVREQLSPVSWAGGSFIKDAQILDNANVVTAAVLVQSGGDTTALEAQITSLQAQLAQAQADLATAQAQNAADAVTIAALQAQVTSLQSQVTSLQSQVASLQAQAATDAATISSLQGQVTTLTAQVASLQSQVTTLTAQIAALAGRATYLYYANLVEILDNLYVPPYFVDDIVNATNAYLTKNPVYYASLTIPTSGYP